ncbi:hypothetical protein [Streptomyces bicolor]|nr:hypothetical protein [Streptomyces bicolor]
MLTARDDLEHRLDGFGACVRTDPLVRALGDLVLTEESEDGR